MVYHARAFLSLHNESQPIMLNGLTTARECETVCLMTTHTLTRTQRVALALAFVASMCIAYVLAPVVAHMYVSTARTVWGTVSAPFTHSAPVRVVPAVQDTHDEHLHNVVTVPACTEEDASGAHDAPVCRWDAATDGLANGGLSYFAVHTDPCTVVFEYDTIPWETINEC